MKNRASILLIVVSILASAFVLSSCQKGQADVPDSEEESINEEIKNSTLTYPSDIKVYYGGRSLIVSPYDVSWAYAINADEWCSVNSESSHPIDMDYKSFFEASTGDTIRIGVFGKINPDAIVCVNRYPVSLWIPGKTDDDVKLREAIARQEDYKSCQECELIRDAQKSVPVKIVGTDLCGYIYDVEVVWDRETFRGSARYAFLIEEQ